MIIAEIPKAKHCSFFCYLLTIDVCIINVWGYTEILPKIGKTSSFGKTHNGKMRDRHFLSERYR